MKMLVITTGTSILSKKRYQLEAVGLPSPVAIHMFYTVVVSFLNISHEGGNFLQTFFSYNRISTVATITVCC